LERLPVSGTRHLPDTVASKQQQLTEEEIVDEQHEYLKVPEVAEILRIARSRAYELVADEKIPSVRIGRSVRVSRRELEKWIEDRRQPSAGRR
jgi:excisionase family DNA binding protein